MTAPASPPSTSPAPSSASGIQQLVLLGAGLAHIQVLAQLTAQPLPGIQVTLVTAQPRHVYANMLSGLVAGHHGLDDCTIALEPLVQRSGIRWIQRSATAVDAEQQTVQLDDGSTLHFDWLSINTGAVQDRKAIEQNLPGASEHALFLRPLEAFGALWPRVEKMGSEQALRVAVVGGGLDGMELALAVRHRLPACAVTLVCGDTPPGGHYPPPVRQRLLAILKRYGVTVLQDSAVAVKPHAVQLGCGAELACDVPLQASAAQAPQWLANSGLALDAQGFAAVDAYLRSTSHDRVFSADGMGAHTDWPSARSGVHAMRAGQALAHNLAAAASAAALKPYRSPATTLHLLSCGGRRAIGIRGRFSAQGWWVWKLKDWLDRRFVALFVRSAARPGGL